jgi:hypothetical protein
MAFPVAPTNGQTAVVNNITYQFSNVGNTWTRILSTANIISANVVSANTLNINNAFNAPSFSATGNITGNYFIGNGALLTGVATGSSSNITNGTSNVVVAASGNITVAVAATSNIAVFASTGEYITGVVSASGNITGGNIITGGLISATGTLSVTGNTTMANISAGNISAGSIILGGLISAVGNITGSYIIGNGSQLTGLPASYGNANVAANLAALGSNPVSTTGNVTGGNVLTGGVISSTGTITGTSHLGAVVSVTANITGGNVLNNGLISSTGNSTAANYLTAGLISSTGNITGGNLSGTAIVGTLTTAAQTAITSVGTLGSLAVTANVSGGNLLTAGLISAGGTITGTSHLGAVVSVTGNITGGGLVGTLYTNSIVNTGANATGNIGSSTLYFNTMFGKATTAQYADLAELYSADADYEPGTVLDFGGDHEVTLSTQTASNKIAGVVSTNPAHLMNSTLESEHTVAVALTGRVPTSVVGTVRKGDMMVSAGNGSAQASAQPAMGTVLGKALADFDGASGVIEIVVGRL